jgi:hypothetical protein
MTTKPTTRYTAAHEAAIRAASPLNQEKANELAASFGADFTGRGIIAKISRMDGVVYNRKAKVTKTGAPVEQKESLAAEIAELVGANLAGLDKAPKPALQAIRNFLVG